MPNLKIAIRSRGPACDHLNGFGSLDQRFNVNWADFLRREGHQVHFFDDSVGCDESFDLAIDAPIHDCRNIKSKKHIHISFNTASLHSTDIQDNPCYQEGRFVLAVPYRVDYLKNLGMISQGFKHIPLFMPIAYPTYLLPNSNTRPGFERQEMMWVNKGNFDRVFDENHPSHFMVSNGLNLLRALNKLNQKIDFKITMGMNSMIQRAKPEWGVEELIGSLKNVERVEVLPWTEVVQRLGKCKFNFHPGGITGGVNEAVFTGALPLTPGCSVHLNVLEVVPDPRTATADELYEVLERLWLDRRHYNACLEAFQDVFQDHRTPALYQHWMNIMKTLELC